MVSPSLGWAWGMRLTVAEEMQLLKMSLWPRCRRVVRKGQQINNRVGGGVWFAVGRQNRKSYLTFVSDGGGEENLQRMKAPGRWWSQFCC